MTGRVLAVDVGERRVGLAISDASRTLARPLEAIAVSSELDAANRVARRIEQLAGEDEEIGAVVVGLPLALDGAATPQTARVRAFIELLAKRTTLPIMTEDERLTSVEAESRLAVHERDWRKRKAQLDAAAAAIFLQDYLDRATSAEPRTTNDER